VNEILTGKDVPDVKGLLAHRLRIASEACDSLRGVKCFTPKDYARVSTQLTEALAIIQEVERIWECLYGSVPSLAEVYQVLRDIA
jgi:hypothetical protein